MDTELIKQNVLKLQNANATPEDIETYVKSASQQSAPNPSLFPQTDFWNTPSTQGGLLGGAINLGKGVVNSLSNMGKGVGTTIGEAGLNLGNAVLSGGKNFAPNFEQPFINKMQQGLSDIKENVLEKPYTQDLNTLSGKTGQLIGDASLIAAPTDAVASGKILTEGVGNKIGLNTLSKTGLAGKTASYIVQKALNAIPEYVAGTGFGLEKGQNLSDANKTGAGFGALSIGGEMAGDAWNQFKGGLNENVGKALGITGKMSSETAVQKIPQATRALNVISKMAPDIKVMDDAGVEKTFDPTKATFAETLQAYNKAKNNIYNAYSDLATKAGDAGATFTAADFQKVVSNIQSGLKDTTSSFKNKATSLIKDLQDNYGQFDKEGNFTGFANTSLDKIQNFIQNINKDVNPLSDKAGSEVSDSFSKSLREIMDNKITNSTNPGYQQLRSSYSDLKSIENDLVNQFKKSARNVGGKVAKYIEGFGTIDTIAGILTSHPLEMAKGIGTFTLGKISQLQGDPEYALQKVFQSLNPEYAKSSASLRAFGGAKPSNFGIKK